MWLGAIYEIAQQANIQYQQEYYITHNIYVVSNLHLNFSYHPRGFCISFASLLVLNFIIAHSVIQ